MLLKSICKLCFVIYQIIAAAQCKMLVYIGLFIAIFIWLAGVQLIFTLLILVTLHFDNNAM